MLAFNDDDKNDDPHTIFLLLLFAVRVVVRGRVLVGEKPFTTLFSTPEIIITDNRTPITVKILRREEIRQWQILLGIV